MSAAIWLIVICVFSVIAVVCTVMAVCFKKYREKVFVVNIALIFMVTVLCFCVAIDLSQPPINTPTITTSTPPTPAVTSLPIATSATSPTPTPLPASTSATSPTPTPTSIAPFTVTVATGLRSYRQDDIGVFHLASTTTPTGELSVYDSNGILAFLINIKTSYWFHVNSYTYVFFFEYPQACGIMFRLPMDASLGTWTWNATFNNGTEQQTLTGTFTVVAYNTQPTPTTPSPTITVALGSNTYSQGDTVVFHLTSTTTTSGEISFYNPNGTLYTAQNISLFNWFPTISGTFIYYPMTPQKSGLLFQLPIDASLGTWTWNATFNNGTEQQTLTGTFTVVARN